MAMVIATNDLARIANGETLSVFLYNAGGDSLATAKATDYFLPRYDMLQVGDIIIVSADTDTATPEVQVCVVLTASSAGVTVASQTA